MFSRATSASRALVPLSLSLSLVGCSLTYCGEESFSRERDIRSGEIAGTALVPDTRAPAAFVQANVRGTSFVRRTNSQGRFVFSGLAEGPWVVTVNEDLDGDGKPERRRVVAATLREAPHRTSPSYVPFVEGETQTRLTGVDVGEVVLEGTVRVEGKVLLEGNGGPRPPVEHGRVGVVVAGRNLDLSKLTTDATEIVSLGAEAKSGVDDEGRFVLRNVSGGDIYLVVLVYELGATPGALGPLVQVSKPISLQAKGDTTVVGGDILLSDDTSPALESVQIAFTPAPSADEQVYLTLVPPGLEMPPCEDAPIDYSGTPFPYAVSSAQVSAGHTVVFNDLPVGLWDIQACFTSSPPGKLYGQTIVTLSDPSDAALIGPVLLTDLDECKPTRSCEEDSDCAEGFTCGNAGICVAPDEEWRDCDGDGARGLPPIENEAHRDVWAACVSACFAEPGSAVADLTCTAPDGKVYDCDDDGDGQPDVTEAQACYGIGKGTDSDGDGLCDGVDPFPECRANTAEECKAGAEPDGPQVPSEYGGGPGPGIDEQCLVERVPLPEDDFEDDFFVWCTAAAAAGQDEEVCFVASMTCRFEPQTSPNPVYCNAATAEGCPETMECLTGYANEEGIAPCAYPEGDDCTNACIEGFVCEEVEHQGELRELCVAKPTDSPSISGGYECSCCGPDDRNCQQINGASTFWSDRVCSDAELVRLWGECYSGWRGGSGVTDGGVPDDAGEAEDAGATADAGSGGDESDAGNITLPDAGGGGD